MLAMDMDVMKERKNQKKETILYRKKKEAKRF